MRGRPFEFGNAFGQGRPPGSPNKKGLMLQRLLLENGEKIVKTLIDRAKKGDRAALALCIERLIPRLKDAAELPFDEQQHTEMEGFEFARLLYKEFTTDEIQLLQRMATRIEALEAKSDDVRAPAPKVA